MYMNKMIEIGKAENGYVVECRVPFKEDKNKEEKGMIAEYPGSCEKKYVAKGLKEVTALVTKLMPMLDEDYKSEEDFDQAFSEAAGMKEDD